MPQNGMNIPRTRADVEKQDLKLQTMLDADHPDEGGINSQVDDVLAARGKLEREFTMMNLDLRKVLWLDHGRQLKSIRAERGPHDRYFFRRIGPPGAAPFPPGAAPMNLLLPPPDGDE